MIAQLGNLAVTMDSLAALMVAFAWIGTCVVLSIRRRRLHLLDVPFAAVLAVAQVAAAIAVIPPGVDGLGPIPLSWPFVTFIVGYGVWRIAGGPPLRDWPWYRFGMLSAVTIILADIGVGAVMPIAPGHAWTLGGAGLRDSLALLPPFLTLTFWGLLDCRSPMTFCSGTCRNANRCRFGLDGKV